jgi:hypothetical protein
VPGTSKSFFPYERSEETGVTIMNNKRLVNILSNDKEIRVLFGGMIASGMAFIGIAITTGVLFI